MNTYTEIKQEVAKNFGLTSREFELLCTRLREGDNSLFEKIYLAHFKKCKIYIKRKVNITFSESYDLTMDTMIDFRKGLIKGKITYGNLEFLFTRMAYYLHLKKQKQLEILDKKEYAYFESFSSQTYDEDKDEKFKDLQKVIKTLSKDKQEFIKLHFMKKMKLAEIAKLTGESNATIRKRKQRIIESLKTKLSKNHKYNL